MAITRSRCPKTRGTFIKSALFNTPFGPLVRAGAVLVRRIGLLCYLILLLDDACAAPHLWLTGNPRTARALRATGALWQFFVKWGSSLAAYVLAYKIVEKLEFYRDPELAYKTRFIRKRKPALRCVEFGVVRRA